MYVSITTLKENGWKAIKDRYWEALLADFLNSTITSTVVGIISGIISTISVLVLNFAIFGSVIAFDSDNTALGILGVIISVIVYLLFFVVIYATILLTIAFIQEPMNVGKYKYYLNNRTGSAQLNDIFFGVTSNYKNIAKVSFFKYLSVLLWSLLFMIPGIIKQYEYVMVPYILAENPDMDSKEAMALSSRLMDGHKFDFFIFTLSFIGWFLLASFTGGIGTLFLMPYFNASITEYYEYVKAASSVNTEIPQ